MKVLIVDDSAIVQERLMSIFDDQKEIQIVGQAQNGIEALKFIKQHKPNAVILDIRMPGGNGIEVLRHIKQIDPSIKVIMFTNYPYSQYRKKCLESGADYFLDKSAEFNKIPEIINQLAKQSRNNE